MRGCQESPSIVPDTDLEPNSIIFIFIIPLFYKKGAFGRHAKYPVEELLPDELKNKKGGQFYTVAPLHYQQRCYGYCVLGNSRLLLDSELFHLLLFPFIVYSELFYYHKHGNNLIILLTGE